MIRLIEKFTLYLLHILIRHSHSNYFSHARRELKAQGYDPQEKDGPNRWIQDNLNELLVVFSLQGHSGSSAPYCANVFKALALFEPIGPLTGVDEEWNEVGDGVFQNNRCSHVFKENGEAYDIEGRIFREPNGGCYTNGKSRVAVVFPYTPKREYVDVPA